MQLPPLDRTPPLRHYSADAASASAVKIASPESANPPVHTPASVRAVSAVQAPHPAQAPSAIEPTPSVINMVGMSNKSSTGDAVYTSVSDPARRGSEAATAPKDWTIHRPEPEKVEDPPPVPLYKVLMDHIKSMWTASASAVQVEQVKNQQEVNKPNPNAAPGVIAAEVLTYSPTKINKTEKM